MYINKKILFFLAVNIITTSQVASMGPENLLNNQAAIHDLLFILENNAVKVDVLKNTRNNLEQFIRLRTLMKNVQGPHDTEEVIRTCYDKIIKSCEGLSSKTRNKLVSFLLRRQIQEALVKNSNNHILNTAQQPLVPLSKEDIALIENRVLSDTGTFLDSAKINEISYLQSLNTILEQSEEITNAYQADKNQLMIAAESDYTSALKILNDTFSNQNLEEQKTTTEALIEALINQSVALRSSLIVLGLRENALPDNISLEAETIVPTHQQLQLSPQLPNPPDDTEVLQSIFDNEDVESMYNFEANEGDTNSLKSIFDNEDVESMYNFEVFEPIHHDEAGTEHL